MKLDRFIQILPLGILALGILLLGTWLILPPGNPGVGLRLPEPTHTDGATPQTTNTTNQSALIPTIGSSVNPTAPPTDLQGIFTTGDGKPVDLPGDWPRFRGRRFDDISAETVPLIHSFPESGPPKLWSIPAGEGYAGVVVKNGRVYFLDYDAINRADVIRCLALVDGKDIWKRAYAVDVVRNHGMSRTVPAVTDHYLLTLGPKCHVVCVDAISGNYLWGIDLVRDYHVTIPAWYAGQCPLIDSTGDTDRAILGTAGDCLLMAVECSSGKVLWKTPNPHNWAMTHTSVMPMTILGRRMYVYVASAGVAGVSADDGTILWEYLGWRVPQATVPSPLQIDERRIFLCGGYGSGSMMLQISSNGSRFAAKQLYTLKPTVFGAEQHTPILYHDHIYGVIPGGQLVCLGLDGKQIWASGAKARFGLGGFMIADGMILLTNDTGRLSAVEATDQGFHLLAQAQLFEDGDESWAPPALAGGRLITRDMTRMVCLDMRKVAP